MPYQKTCSWPPCGKAFTSKEAKSKYCSHKCSYEASVVVRPLRKCANPDCGIDFEWRRKEATYCSEECAQEARRKKRAGKKQKAAAQDADRDVVTPNEVTDLPSYVPVDDWQNFLKFPFPEAQGPFIPQTHAHRDPWPDQAGKPHTRIGKRIIVIPDTQVKPGISFEYLRWVGLYIAEKRPDIVVHLGDHWDMQSLSTYDKGKKCFEGRRYVDDIEAGNEAMSLLTSQYRGVYKPEEHFLIGNHSERINRATDIQPELTGVIGFHHLNLGGWNVHSFLQVVEIEGIKFSHYFTSGLYNRPVSSAQVMLRVAQGSAVQGHSQKVDMAIHEKTGKIALMCGVCYLRDEEYLGPQGNNCRRQIVVLNEVHEGTFDPMFCSLRYLEARFGRGVESA